MTIRERRSALDPFRGYANAIRGELPEAITVLDAFHVVKLGSAVVEEARRRVVPASGSRQFATGLDLSGGRTRLSLHVGLTMLDHIPGSPSH
ncbi:transposase [uncultured Arthrobacter sp.]|uniref:transposase n=1 Tax=uncultured Arthrobacter sp. TaxID=114050 RepID=UPI0028D6D6EE|nr:transposase [uncultured Arthrobacter sp.]